MRLKIDTGHKPCEYIGNGCPPSTQLWANRLNSGASESITHMPFTLKGHNFCSRIFETMQIEALGITSASSALAALHGKGKGEKTCRRSPCFCVCVSVCILSIQQHHWTWKYRKEFDWSWKVAIPNAFPIVCLSCPWMAEVLHHLGIWLSHSFFVFLCNKVQYIWSGPEFHSSPASSETVSVAT